jgi:hypothetical protein
MIRRCCSLAIGCSFFLAAIFLPVAAFSDPLTEKRPEISPGTRVEMIRLLNAEYVWVRKPFPVGDKGLTIKSNGELVPSDRDLYMQIVQRGPVARPGQRVQITNIEFKGKRVVFEINGGPVKKAKWYQRIEIMGAGGGSPVAPGPDNRNAKGSLLTVEFKDHVPEMTLAEFREILKPVFDFTVKSAAQAYTESLPENVRNAIRDKKVLVGMNKEMVTYAKGRPPQRIREKQNGQEYEEWIFGQSPADVEFVRFEGDEVVQVKIMKVGGEKIVKTEREVKLDDPALVVAARPESEQQPEAPAARPGNAPSMRRPGEIGPDKPAGVPSSPPSVQVPDPPPGPPNEFAGRAHRQ